MGENLAEWGGSSESEGSEAVDMWYTEHTLYDYSQNEFQYSAGHFSQLVNK